VVLKKTPLYLHTHRQQHRQYSNEQYLQFTNIGITDTILNRVFVFLFYQRQYTLLHKWRSLLKLRHCTTYLTAFTNLTVHLQKQILQSCLQMLFQASHTGTIALVVSESGQSSYTITLLRQHSSL